MMRRSTRGDREGLARNMVPTRISLVYAEFSEFADPTDRRDVTVHRIQAFEGDQSLWRQICLSTPDCLIPAIIELWFLASDRIRQSGRSFAIVAIPVWFET